MLNPDLVVHNLLRTRSLEGYACYFTVNSENGGTYWRPATVTAIGPLGILQPKRKTWVQKYAYQGSCVPKP